MPLSWTRQRPLSGDLFSAPAPCTQHSGSQHSPRHATCTVHGPGQDSGTLTRNPDSGCRRAILLPAPIFTSVLPGFCPDFHTSSSVVSETSHPRLPCALRSQIYISSPDFPGVGDSCVSPLHPLATAQPLSSPLLQVSPESTRWEPHSLFSCRTLAPKSLLL